MKVGERHFRSFPAARWRGRDGRPSRGLGRAKGHPSRPIIIRDDPVTIGQWSNALCPDSQVKRKMAGPFWGPPGVGSGEDDPLGIGENLRSRNERAVTRKTACNTVCRRSMGLWSKFGPDKTRVLIHLMSERPERRRQGPGRMGESFLPASGHAGMLTCRLWGDLCDTIPGLRCTLRMTNSQSADRWPVFRAFDPSETMPLTSKQ